jgi:transposase
LTVVVAIDVGKNEFAVSVTTAARRRLLKPRLGCPMTAPSVREVVARISRLLPTGAVVKVGIEAAGHYHLPLLAAALWPTGWELLELNPAHVTEQRRVLGKRTIKTDVIDLEAMTELLLAGRGLPVTATEVVLGRADGLVGAPDPPDRDPERAEEPAPGPARPVLPGTHAGAA